LASDQMSDHRGVRVETGLAIYSDRNRIWEFKDRDI